jgi:hypothetical protein
VFNAQAVLQSVPPLQSGSPPLSPRVRLVTVLGPDTMSSSSIDGVLIDIPLPSDLNAPLSTISRAADFKVLLFSEALEPREPGLAGVHCQSADDGDIPGGTGTGAEAGAGAETPAKIQAVDDAYEIADGHARRFESMGVRLVACRELWRRGDTFKLEQVH